MSNKKPSVDYAEFISLPIALEEIRFTLNLEFNRKNSIENKASMLIAFIGLIITLITLEWPAYIKYLIPFYLPLIVSLLYCLRVIKPSQYKFPHEKIGDFFQYAKQPKKVVMDQFLLDLMDVTEELEGINNEKGKWLQLSYRLFFVALVYFGIWAIVF